MVTTKEEIVTIRERQHIPTGIPSIDQMFTRDANKNRGIPTKAATLVLGSNDLDYFAFQISKNYIEYMKKVESSNKKDILRGPMIIVSIDEPKTNLVNTITTLVGWSEIRLLNNPSQKARQSIIRRYLRIEDRYDWASSGSPDTLYVKIRQAREIMYQRDSELVDANIIPKSKMLTRDGGIIIIYTLSKLSLYFGNELDTIKFVNMLTSEALIHNFAVLYLVDPEMHKKEFISALERVTDIVIELIEPEEEDILEHFITARGITVEDRYEGKYFPYIILKGLGIVPVGSIKNNDKKTT